MGYILLLLLSWLKILWSHIYVKTGIFFCPLNLISHQMSWTDTSNKQESSQLYSIVIKVNIKVNKIIISLVFLYLHNQFIFLFFHKLMHYIVTVQAVQFELAVSLIYSTPLFVCWPRYILFNVKLCTYLPSSWLS